MSNKVSVITVVRNDVANIRQTMESFFSQTWEDKEYIVIDGGSNDGTADVIREYSSRLAYWCSEKDGGIYDAMNKGIGHATGDWINILNSGDRYCSEKSLEKVFADGVEDDVDVVYGNSIEIREECLIGIVAGDNADKMETEPIYRHGSSFVRTSVQRKFPYDTSLKDTLGYALDWEMIHRLLLDGRKFKKTPVWVESYPRDGVSDNLAKSLLYQYRIASQGSFSPRKAFRFARKYCRSKFAQTAAYKWMRGFLMEYLVNDILPHIPFWSVRRFILKRLRVRIGHKSFVMKHNYIMSANRLSIGNCSDVNRGCTLDARGGIAIGDNVSISHGVRIMSGSHDLRSSNFRSVYMPVEIGDFVWIGVGATVLGNVRIGKGAVVCAGAVVTRDVDSFSIVAGIPARKIGERRKDLDYHCIWNSPFT